MWENFTVLPVDRGEDKQIYTSGSYPDADATNGYYNGYYPGWGGYYTYINAIYVAPMIANSASNPYYEGPNPAAVRGVFVCPDVRQQSKIGSRSPSSLKVHRLLYGALRMVCTVRRRADIKRVLACVSSSFLLFRVGIRA